MVEIKNLARPLCETASLQQEWLGDFSQGGLDPSQFDGDRDTQSAIRETRSELNAAFGRTLTVDEIHSLTVADIPRCRIATVEEALATAPSTRRSPTAPTQILSSSGFADALHALPEPSPTPGIWPAPEVLWPSMARTCGRQLRREHRARHLIRTIVRFTGPGYG